MATITITFESDDKRCGKTTIARALHTTLKKLGYNVSYDFKPSTKRNFSKKQLENSYSNENTPEIDFPLLVNPRADVIIVPE